MGRYFGTDGIRGEFGNTLTEETAFKLGKALKALNSKIVVIGTDTRQSKDALASMLAKGAMSMGLEVLLAYVVPTPALIYYSKIKGITGVMITASHNPFYDNGIKVFDKGYKLTSEKESLLEDVIDEVDMSFILGKGSIDNCNDILDVYYGFMSKQVAKSNVKIALDCANGATYQTAKHIFSDVTNNLFLSSITPNGKNINENCGSTHINNISSFVKENSCDVGFAFDGDGDRCLAVDNNGILYDGDKLIYIIALYLKEKNMLRQNKIVLTKMSNLGLINNLKEKGIDAILTNVGDKYVVASLFDNDLSIGGENSGHIIIKDILTTGDGVLVALMITKIMEETKKNLKELTKDVFMYPDKMVNVRVKDKKVIEYTKEIQEKVKEIEKILGNNGKIILRASGTEDLVRVTVSAKSEKLVNLYSDMLVELVKKYGGV